MLSEGSPNVNRPACGKKIRKINKQFLYHRDPMWPPLDIAARSPPKPVSLIKLCSFRGCSADVLLWQSCVNNNICILPQSRKCLCLENKKCAIFKCKTKIWTS